MAIRTRATIDGYSPTSTKSTTTTSTTKPTTSYTTTPRISGFDFDAQTKAALIANPPTNATYTPAPSLSGTPTLTPKVTASTPTAPPPMTTAVPPPPSVAPPTVAPPTPQNPPGTTQPQQPQQQGPIADATAFDSGTLNQILTALEAKYGLSREQLLAEQGEVGRLYRFINANLTRMEQDATRGNVEASLGRGILRSGIHLENQANIEQDFTERRAQAEGEKATKLAYIQNQLATLQSELEQERMSESQRFGQRGMDFARQFASTF